jgi:hypothetical protein
LGAVGINATLRVETPRAAKADTEKLNRRSQLEQGMYGTTVGASYQTPLPCWTQWSCSAIRGGIDAKHYNGKTSINSKFSP